MNPYNKKNEGAIAGPGQLSYSFEHLHMEKPRAWKTMDGVRLSSMLFTRLKDISHSDRISWFWFHSTIFTPIGSPWVSSEAKLSTEIEFGSLVR